MKSLTSKTLQALLLATIVLLIFQSCKPKGAQSAVSGDAASKAYIAPREV